MTRQARTAICLIGVGTFLFAMGFLAGERSGEGRAYGTVTSWQVERAGKSSLGPNLKAP